MMSPPDPSRTGSDSWGCAMAGADPNSDHRPALAPDGTVVCVLIVLDYPPWRVCGTWIGSVPGASVPRSSVGQR